MFYRWRSGVNICTVLTFLVVYFPTQGLPPIPEPEWQTYGSKEGNFTIKLPDKPAAHVRETELTGVPGKTRFQSLELEEEEIIYAVSFTDLPQEVVARKDFLDKVGFANLGGIFSIKLDAQAGTATTFRGYPGRKFQFSFPDHGEVVARVLLVKQRLYIILAAAEEIDAETPEVKKFLDSFAFHNDPQ